MAFAPALYIWYTIVVAGWLHYNRNDGYYTHEVPWWMQARTYVPDIIPLKLFATAFLILEVSITFAALRIGEIGMDVLKSIPPLLVALNPRSAGTLTRLQKKREELATRVTNLINTLGPEVFPDFDATTYRGGSFQRRSISVEGTNECQMLLRSLSEPPTPTSGADERSDDPSGPKSPFNLLPSNEAFKNIGDFGFFSSRPQTPKSRSRSSSAGGALSSSSFPIKAMTSLDSNEGFDQLSRRIRGAMRERGRKRESDQHETGTEDSYDMVDDSAPDSDEAKKRA